MARKLPLKKLIFQRRKSFSSEVRLATNNLMATKAPKKTTSKRKPNAAFLKPVTPDEKLAAVVGSKPLPRTEIVSKLWVYIKKNNLQDKKVKTQINGDDTLKAIFDGKKSVTMFEMNKYVSKHLVS
jgi:chromatin remodeling complex protein RSC6